MTTTAARVSATSDSSEVVSLKAHPVKARAGILWTIRLDTDVLTIVNTEDRAVFQVHREEAARYVRFSRDVFRGRTVTFVIIEGMRSHSFQCTKEMLRKLLAWLPNKSPHEIANEVRISAAGLVLFGILHLILPGVLFWGWAFPLFLVAACGFIAPKARMFLANGVLMVCIGLLDLVPWSLTAAAYPMLPPEMQAIPIAVGSILILWGIHQISLKGPSQQLRAARTVRDRQTAFLPARSRVVRLIGGCNVAAAVFFGLYAFTTLLDAPQSFEAQTQSVDAVVLGTLMLLSACSAAVLLLRKRAGYLEAKVSAQCLIFVAELILLAVLNKQFGSPAAVSAAGALYVRLLTLLWRPYVWGGLILCVLAFNRWFAREVDKELEEQRG